MPHDSQAESAADSSDAAPSGVGYRRLWIIAVVVLVLDQLTKLWVVEALPASPYINDGITVIPGFFHIIHVYNKGAAWGMFAGYAYVLALLGVVALAAIFYFRKQLELHRPFVQVIFGLLIGGIIGNMIDRFAYGHVVDFLDFHFGNYRYPTFNIADCGITVGVALYVILTLVEGWKEKKTTAKAGL